jgi:hypothetical protein
MLRTDRFVIECQCVLQPNSDLLLLHTGARQSGGHHLQQHPAFQAVHRYQFHVTLTLLQEMVFRGGFVRCNTGKPQGIPLAGKQNMTHWVAKTGSARPGEKPSNG